MDLSIEKEGQLVNAEKWPNMTLKELYVQKTILGNRLETAYNIKNQIILKSLQEGLNNIEFIILNKSNDEDLNNKNIII